MNEVMVPFEDVFQSGLVLGVGTGVAVGAGAWAAFAVLDAVTRQLWLWSKRRALAKYVAAGEPDTDDSRVAM